MKKSTRICTLLLIVVLVLSSLLMTACGKNQFKQLKEDIDKVGTYKDGQHKYDYKYGDINLAIYYFDEYPDVIGLNVWSYSSSSSIGAARFFMNIDSKCSGEYNVEFSLSGSNRKMQAFLSAKYSTSDNLVIHNREYENVPTTLRTSFDDLAESYAKACLSGFCLFLSTYSDLTPADFGFESMK